MGDPLRQQHTMTFADAAQLDPDDTRGELDRGRWLPVTRNTWAHGEIVGNVYALLRAYAREHGGWSVSVGDPGTKLATNPDTLRGPDVGVIHDERRPTGRGVDGWLEGAPDLAVEVAGDTQSATELARKALEYLAAGGRMVWVVDAEPRHVMVFLPPNQVRVLGPDDELDGGDVLPGLRCRVAELFE